MTEQSLREVASGSPTEEVKEASDRLMSDQTIRPEDVTTVVEAVGGSFWDHVHATGGVHAVSMSSPGVLEDRYPEIVESILASRDARAVARSILHECTSLRVMDVPVETINSGVETVFEWLTARGDVLATQTEVGLADRVREYADSVEGREQLVVEAMADAFEEVPKRRAVAAGLDPIDALVDLRAQYHAGDTAVGIDDDGQVGTLSEDAIDDAQTSFRRLHDGLTGAGLILQFERDPAQLLRSEAVLLERL